MHTWPDTMIPDVAMSSSVESRPSADGIGLLDAARRAVVGILNVVLADEFVLYAKTRRFHWNVEGPNFAELHALFQQQYEQLSDIVDEVAERARMLDGYAAGSLEEYLELTRLGEDGEKRHVASGMIASLLADHEQLIRALRDDLERCASDYGDDGTTDFLTRLLQSHEKMAWMLRAYLKQKGRLIRVRQQSTRTLEALLTAARGCRACEQHLPLGPRRVLQAGAAARILVVGQAPGARVHASGIPWDDASGERLRTWMASTSAPFYDESRVAIVPMGYCYPGRVKGGDLPPRSECAELWLDLLLSKLPKVELPLIVGGHAQRHFLGRRREGGNLSSRKDSGQMWMRDTTP